MSDLIDRQALKNKICDCCEGKDEWCNGPCFEIMIIDSMPAIAASPWRRVEEGLPKMRELVPGYVCSEILVLYDAESKYADIGYAREKPDNGVDWLWGKPRKNPTHWTYFEPPKEDA